ncbi:hypothetical protein DV515_00009548 [Chloebia gouldiae]|uniref:Fibronectin type-III domain-containing protein n=1 Tax=Chloebia gouldiae TaxID=44316 RepID=A0A3L8SCX5_CHLGU|nr:hypothetical protein DV515_00009548 [Chloebia gouldiae]
MARLGEGMLTLGWSPAGPGIVAGSRSCPWEQIRAGDRNKAVLPAPKPCSASQVRCWRHDEKEENARRIRTVGNQTSTKVSNLRGNALYHLAVRAYNTAGTGPSSAAVNVTTKKPPPSQPPGNIVWNSSDSKIILNWDQVKALDNESEVRGYKDYIIEIKPFSDGGDGSSSEQIRIPKISNAYARGSGSSTSSACTLSALSTIMISLTARSSL